MDDTKRNHYISALGIIKNFAFQINIRKPRASKTYVKWLKNTDTEPVPTCVDNVAFRTDLYAIESS